MSDPRQRYATLVREGRERLGLKQDELAERCGVSQPTVSGWENKGRMPGFRLAMKVAGVLGIDAAEMVSILSSAEDPEPEAVAG